MASSLTLENLVVARERVLFALMALFGAGVYAVLIAVGYNDPAIGGSILFYGFIIVFAGFMARAYALGRLRGSAVLVNERQFPLVHKLVTSHARRLGMKYVPTVYVVESGGILNAFATKLLGQKFIILNADVLALAVRRGGAAVSFIIGHEVGHHWRGHLKWHWLIGPGRLMPYLGGAYSRSCEYTCDRVGAYCEPAGAIDGLLVLAAGGWLHAHVNAQEFAKQATTDNGFWVRRMEIVSTHPRLPKRVAALLTLGLVSSPAEPMSDSAVVAPPGALVAAQ